jgi:hypothetical protein
MQVGGKPRALFLSFTQAVMSQSSYLGCNKQYIFLLISLTRSKSFEGIKKSQRNKLARQM